MESLEKLYQLTKNLTLLYVEDDTALREKTTQMFQNMFCKVDSACNGFEGWKLYEDYYNETGSYYDIVVTDIKMPMLNGVELSKKIKNLNQSQIIVVTSAYDNSQYLIEFININVNKFMKKPFSLENLINTFSDLLDNKINEGEQIHINESFYWENKKKQLYNKDLEVKFSYSETLIFDMLINNKYQIFSNNDLLYVMSDIDLQSDSSDNIVKSAIKRLRKKIPEQLIQNVYGQGYKICID